MPEPVLLESPAAVPAATPTPLQPRPRAQASIRRHLALSLALGTVLVVGIGGWASFTDIAGAVIAPGQLVVDPDQPRRELRLERDRLQLVALDVVQVAGEAHAFTSDS